METISFWKINDFINNVHVVSLVEREKLFAHPTVAGGGALRMHENASRDSAARWERRVERSAGRHPAASATHILKTARVAQHDVHEDHIAPRRFETREAHTKLREQAPAQRIYS